MNTLDVVTKTISVALFSYLAMGLALLKSAASICFEVRGAWIRSEKFSISSEKSFRISKKISIFQAKISDYLFLNRQLRNFSFTTKRQFFPLFLENNRFPTYFQSEIRYSIFPNPSTTPPTTPCDLPRPPSPKSGGRDSPTFPGLTPLVRVHACLK